HPAHRLGTPGHGGRPRRAGETLWEGNVRCAVTVGALHEGGAAQKVWCGRRQSRSAYLPWLLATFLSPRVTSRKEQTASKCRTSTVTSVLYRRTPWFARGREVNCFVVFHDISPV